MTWNMFHCVGLGISFGLAGRAGRAGGWGGEQESNCDTARLPSQLRGKRWHWGFICLMDGHMCMFFVNQ